MIVKVNELPPEIRNQLPISLRIRDELETSSLPYKLRELIEEYFKDTITTDNKSNIYDVSLTAGIYDVKNITDIKEAVKNFIMNFFTISKGSYPFDPNFGTILYKTLQTKNSTYIEEVISNEITSLSNELTKIFNTRVTIDKVSINFNDNDLYTNVIINLTFSVENSQSTITLNVNQ